MSTPVMLHLVSHGSGELIEMLARNAVVQLEGVQADRRIWKMVRRLGQLPDILAEVAAAPGFVLHSISDPVLREALESGCRQLGAPCHDALAPLVGALAGCTGASVRAHTSSVDAVDEEYFRRVEAMKYALAHDDGLACDDLDGAEVIVVGVSRATKTPTCMYLASRGIKAANVPLVPGVRLPDSLLKPRSALVVGLIVDAQRLAAVRSERLRALHQDPETSYTDAEALRLEVRDAQRLFVLRGWPIINVSERSIEQTASKIIELLQARHAASGTALAIAPEPGPTAGPRPDAP